MSSMKTLVASILFASVFVLGILAGGSARAQSADPALAPVKAMEGTIQTLDFGSNSMIFEGLRYRMAPDVQVEIRGSYGAFTMLQEGMKAAITYRVVSGSERVVTRIEQLPDNVELEGV